MIKKEDIIQLTEMHLAPLSHFLVEVKVSVRNEIEVCIDDPKGIQLDDCIALSHAIEAGLNREEEDFELTVTSAGLDQPLKVFPQYLKFLNQEVEVVLLKGEKIKGLLMEAQPEQISLNFSKMETVEGKKRKQKVDYQQTFALKEIKSTKPIIHFR